MCAGEHHINPVSWAKIYLFIIFIYLLAIFLSLHSLALKGPKVMVFSSDSQILKGGESNHPYSFHWLCPGVFHGTFFFFF